jgi:hypothetical protein
VIQFQFDQYVPPGASSLVVAPFVQIEGAAHYLGEVSHNNAENTRVLTYWLTGVTDGRRVPLFDFVAALSSANAIMHRGDLERDNGPPRVLAEKPVLVVSPEDGDDRIHLTEESGEMIATVRWEMGELVVSLWGRESHETIDLPLFETMEAILGASMRLDRNARF